MNIKLVIPDKTYRDRAVEFRNEFFTNGEKVINGSSMLDNIESYEEWLQVIERNADPLRYSSDWVLTDVFFAVDEDDRIIGIIDFRHELKVFLKDFGHTGYSVRPSCRSRGFATVMLGLLKEKAANMGYSELQLSVERSNIPSVKTILKNGGELSRSFTFNGEQADVYIIKL